MPIRSGITFPILMALALGFLGSSQANADDPDHLPLMQQKYFICIRGMQELDPAKIDQIDAQKLHAKAAANALADAAIASCADKRKAVSAELDTEGYSPQTRESILSNIEEAGRYAIKAYVFAELIKARQAQGK